MVYFIRSEATGDRIKIGMAKDVEKRVKSLALPGAEVLATVPGGRDKEAELHKRFARLRVGDSEWFTPGNDLLTYLDGLASGDAGDIGRAVRHTWAQVDRLARVVAAMAFTLLLAGCGRAAVGATVNGAASDVPWYAWLFIAVYVLLMAYAVGRKGAMGDNAGGDGEEYAVEESEWQRRQRLVFCKDLVGPDGSPILLVADPMGPKQRITTYDRYGNVRAVSEELLPHAVYTPETGTFYDVQSGTLEIDERLAKPILTAKLLKAAGGWPRAAAEQAPLALPEPLAASGAWLPPLQEFDLSARAEAERVNEDDY